MSHTLSAPLLSRLSSLSAELSELCGLCDLLADPMHRNFVFASLRTLSEMAEDAAEVLGQLADGEENPRRRLLPSLLDGYARNLAFVPPVMEAIAAARAELAANPEWEPFVQMQRQHLLDLRDRALDNMSGVARDTLRNHPEGSEASGSGEHQADAGSDAYDRDFALSLLSKEQDGLYEIEQALARIDNGTYGICEMSYKVIPILRLEAIPFARLTVECQAQWEKEKGQNARFRPRVALGFAGGQNDVDLSVSLDDDEE